MAMDNKTIGKFQLTGIPPAPRGMPQVEVTFDIDANGILHVSAPRTGANEQGAEDPDRGLERALRCRDRSKMVQDAEELTPSDDEERREKVTESRNQPRYAGLSGRKGYRPSGVTRSLRTAKVSP